MSLRLVNAVFFEPKHRFIVVYQNGSLWQLPRMNIDIISWRNRKSYNGSKNSLHLMREQKIRGPRLSKIIPTQDLPTNLTNINLPKFESWWSMNGYAWLQKKKEEKESLTESNSEPDNIITDSMPPMHSNFNASSRNVRDNTGNTINQNRYTASSIVNNNRENNNHVTHNKSDNNSDNESNRANSNSKIELSFLAKRHIAQQKEQREQQEQQEQQQQQQNKPYTHTVTETKSTVKTTESQHKKISRETLQANRKIQTKY